MDVIISMAAKGQKIIYHRQNCMYVEKMKPQNRMVLSQKTVKKQRFCSCLYCGGLKGELRTNPQFSAWEKEYGIAIDYIEKTMHCMSVRKLDVGSFGLMKRRISICCFIEIYTIKI